MVRKQQFVKNSSTSIITIDWTQKIVSFTLKQNDDFILNKIWILKQFQVLIKMTNENLVLSC